MKITKLIKNADNELLLDVYVDGSYLAAFSRETIEKSGLYEGAELDDGSLEKISRTADRTEALGKALHLLEYRDHTRKELYDKLVTRGFSEDIAEAACDTLEKKGYINDVEYAKRLAEVLYKGRSYGANRVAQELYRRGLSAECIEDIRELAPDPVPEIHKLLKTRFKYTDTDDYAARKKVAAALYRLGYSYEDIREALELYEDE